MESTERTRERLIAMQMLGDRLHERFHRLRTIVAGWENRIVEISDQVLDCFYQEDLAAIRNLLEEKKILLEQIRSLQAFIAKWENPGFGAGLGVIKAEDEQGKRIFQ